jgi:hypothetical protein
MIPGLPLALIVAGSLVVAMPAVAATNGITVVSPKSGAKVPAGKSPTFKVRVQGAGTVWVHVCKSKKKDSEGVICHDESIGQAKKKGGVFAYKPKLFTFPGFWLVTPGTYYWQAHRIDCAGDTGDCRQEGPVVKFKVG